MIDMGSRSTVLHYPRLDTVLMIEGAIKGSPDCLSRTALWRGLPRKVMYQTFKVAVDYLIASRKVLLTKDDKLVWVFADSPMARKLLKKSVPAFG